VPSQRGEQAVSCEGFDHRVHREDVQSNAVEGYTKPGLRRFRAAELVRLSVALMLAWGATNALAAQHATTTICIVFVGVASPVGRGLVANLPRSGGNITRTASEGHPDGGPGSQPNS
jgi:ABC transporter substrate binding protein